MSCCIGVVHGGKASIGFTFDMYDMHMADNRTDKGFWQNGSYGERGYSWVLLKLQCSFFKQHDGFFPEYQLMIMFWLLNHNENPLILSQCTI